MTTPAQALTEVHDVPVLPPRAADANKGTFGHVLVIAGSRGMSGAAVLCAGAALRGGAGLVRVAIPASLLALVAPANPCYMTAPVAEDAAGRFSAAAQDELLEHSRWATAVALGPGLAHSPELTTLVQNLVERTTVPLVLDADGLNALAGHLEPMRNRRAPLVLTPHPGEFARLAAGTIPSIQADRSRHAARLAMDIGAVVVLKGHGTVVTDGRRVYVNTTGNPGMATGGTGDVLTGLTAALLAQGLETFAAAMLAVYLHGLAGDLARDERGETSLVASDLLNYLPRAFLAHSRGRPSG
jgi:NAD(P)H-hydrate epimerase